MTPDWLGSPQHFAATFVIAFGCVRLFRTRIADLWLLAALGAGVACAAEVAFEIVEWAWLWEPLTFEAGYLDLVADLAASLAGAIAGAAAGAVFAARNLRAG